jgi:hypothetical protein
LPGSEQSDSLIGSTAENDLPVEIKDQPGAVIMIYGRVKGSR